MSFDAGFLLGLSMGGGGGKYDIYIVNYSDSSLLLRCIDDRSKSSPKLTDYSFLCEIKEFKISTTAKTSKGEITHIWSKNIITSVADDNRNIVWSLTPDTSGKITAVYDQNGNDVLNGITAGESVNTNSPQGVALGYALAYNKEQDELTERILDAYKQGIDDDEDIGTEDEETDVTETDLHGNGAVYYVIFDDGIRYQYLECEYIQIYSFYSNGKPSHVYIKGCTHSFRMGIGGHVENDADYDPPRDMELTTSHSLIADVASVRLAGTVFDANGDIYTGNMII